MKSWVTLVNWTVITASIIFISLGCHQIRAHDRRTFGSVVTSRIFVEPKRIWRSSPANPPAPIRSQLGGKTSIYVAVIDFDNQPGLHQCRMKSQWMDKFANRDDVEDIEIYSLTSWTNPNCGMRSLSVPLPPKDYVDSSSWLFVNSLEIALNRSNSGWLFVVRDSVYIRVSEFFRFFEERMSRLNPFESIQLFGGCLERRYFFQMLMPESGLLMSRRFAREVLRPDIREVWSVAMEAGIHYDEAFAHLSDQLGIYMKSSAIDQMLGRPWRNESQFQFLANKSFDLLPICMIPVHYIYNSPGELGLCSIRVTPFNSIIAWAAASETISKVDFLDQAERYLEGNPDNLGFYWDLTKPTLCIIGSKTKRLPTPPPRWPQV
jgi:hypothetical protein